MQSAVRDLGIDTVGNPKICLELVKSLIPSLPLTHRLHQTVKLMSEGDMWSEDSEIYDIFCHSQDKAYSVEEIFDFIREGGGGDLSMASWHQPILYKPSTFIQVCEHEDRSDKLNCYVLYSHSPLNCFYTKNFIPISSDAPTTSSPLAGSALTVRTS